MWQAEADRADTVCFACHGSGLNSVNHGEILLEYGIAMSMMVIEASSIFCFFSRTPPMKFMRGPPGQGGANRPAAPGAPQKS